MGQAEAGQIFSFPSDGKFSAEGNVIIYRPRENSKFFTHPEWVEMQTFQAKRKVKIFQPLKTSMQSSKPQPHLRLFT